MIALDAPSTDIVGARIEIDGVDPEQLKDGTYLRNGIGRVEVHGPGGTFAAYDTTGVVTFGEGGVQLVGKPVDGAEPTEGAERHTAARI